MRLLFWRLVRDLSWHVIQAAHDVHWWARGRIGAEITDRRRHRDRRMADDTMER